MRRYNKILSFFALAVMMMGLTVIASAQGRNNRRNNGSYGNTSYYNLDSTIKNLRNNSRSFRDNLDRELDNSRYDGSRREDQLNDLAKRFEKAAKDLDGAYDNNRDFNRSRDEAQRVIGYGSQLDQALSVSRANRNSNLRGQWDSIESDLRTISQAYGVSYNGRRGNNGGIWDNDRNDRDDRNDRNRGNNRYPNGNGNRGYNANLRSTIVNLRNKSRRFEDRLDRERNNRSGNRYSGNLENLSDRFNDAVKKLEDEYRNDRDYNDSRNEVQRVLSIGEQIDREISRASIDRSLRNDWDSIERDLRTLADAFNMNYNGRNGGGRLGDILRNLPF